MVRQAYAAAAQGTGLARSRFRSTGRGPPRAHRRRSRTRGPSRGLDAGRERHALRRVRPAADFDDLRPGEPISRDPGSDAAIPDRSGRAREALRPRGPDPELIGYDRAKFADRLYAIEHEHADGGGAHHAGADRRLRDADT